MKYLIIGDLHGKSSIVNDVLSDKFDDYTKIFVGDYVDSFDASIESQIDIVIKLLDAVEDRDDVIALLGNHELSYILDGMMCSGFNTVTKAHLIHLQERMFELFKTHYYISEDILVTHAGANGELFESKEELKECLIANDPCLYDIGWSRGGRAKFGGVFWCDYWAEFEPIEGLTQIVGHSARRPEGKYEGIVFEKRCYNIDCLDRVNEVLEYDDELKAFEEVNLDGY